MYYYTYMNIKSCLSNKMNKETNIYQINTSYNILIYTTHLCGCFLILKLLLNKTFFSVPKLI